MSELSLSERLRWWAQNEEMIDSSFTQHGRDCNEAADENERLRQQLHLTNIDWANAVAEANDLRAQLAEAREYVEHLPFCSRHPDERCGYADHEWVKVKCDCGLDAFLAAQERKP